MPIDEKFLASRKRKVLAWYLDFLLYLAFFELLGYFGGFFGLHILIKVAVFVLIEFFVVRKMYSPGCYFLSIYKAEGETEKPAIIVDPTIKSQENWLTMLVGVLFILDGTKSLVRWTEGLPIMPIMGVREIQSKEINFGSSPCGA